MDQFYLSVTSDFKKRLITKLVPREPDFDEELVDGIISVTF